MSFTWSEIVTGMISAVIYGGLFAIIACFIRTCVSAADDVFMGIKAAFLYTGSVFDTSGFRTCTAARKVVDGEIIRAFGVILYTLGFFLASYIGFDGEIRLYNLLISLCAFYVVRALIGLTLERVILFVLTLALRLLIPVVRISLYPIRALFSFVSVKLKKQDRIYEDA